MWLNVLSIALAGCVVCATSEAKCTSIILIRSYSNYEYILLFVSTNYLRIVLVILANIYGRTTSKQRKACIIFAAACLTISFDMPHNRLFPIYTIQALNIQYT
ncbi:hypothetical protein POJ06DRAFT_10816 [Lipomyces tetrasporus]|uniref:Uncharacterized protein n=1 Tax=Lipomyces tetrasporus TaxID=54092 RepID=A0AAD7VWI6_9ASCO|nr:uncharacterized protein POJ06DRAFT_10816 [Lipomyces tetrasporus]KAJ8104004.1 hypothetical protein POJ06DRAFT_10816 [Lipomyces tetrasporus]